MASLRRIVVRTSPTILYIALSKKNEKKAEKSQKSAKKTLTSVAGYDIIGKLSNESGRHHKTYENACKSFLKKFKKTVDKNL